VRPLCPATKTLLVAVVIVSLSACGSEPIVGVLLPTTGSAATYGESMKNGIDLALEQEQGNLPEGFQIKWGDTASDPETGAAELRRITAEGARLVIAGTTSGTARALLPVLDETNTIAISPSASEPSLTKDSRRFFRVFSSDELEGRRAGRFLYEEQDRTSVIIYAVDSDQARGIEPPFRQVFDQAMGGEIVGRVMVHGADWEKESADLLAASRPASAYIIGYGDTTVEVLRHLREKRFEGPICATSAFYTGQIVEDHPELVEGVYFPQPAFDVRSEGQMVQDFVKSYRQKYQDDPDIYAAHAFDTMRVAIWVANQTKVFTASDIRKTLAFHVKEFPGVTGIIQFNDYGDVHHNPIMFIIKDGQVLNYERYVEEEKAKIRERIRNILKG